MVFAFSDRNAFVSFLAVILSFSVLLIALIVVVPLPSFADRIVAIRQGTTLAIGCDLGDNDDFMYTRKVLNYDQPTKLTLKCERSEGDVDLKKGESMNIGCLHDSPLTIPKHAKMKSGELFYILCNVKVKQNSG
jgi:hypothetical protein